MGIYIDVLLKDDRPGGSKATPREETGRLVVLADFLAYFDIFGQY